MHSSQRPKFAQSPFRIFKYAIANDSDYDVSWKLADYLNCYDNAENLDEYEFVSEKYCEYLGQNTELFNALGYLYSKHKKYSKSLEYFNKSLNLNPDDVYALSESASLLLYGERPFACIQRCHKVLKQNPRNRDANYTCAVAHLSVAKRSGKKSAKLQYRAALQMLLIAQDAGTDQENLPYYIGYCLNRLSRYSAALQYLRTTLLRRTEFNCALWCEIGIAMRRSGRVGRVLALAYFMYKNRDRFEHNLITPLEYMQFV